MTLRNPVLSSKIAVGLFVFLIFVTPFSIAAIEITFPLLLVTWMVRLLPSGGPSKPLGFSQAERGILFALLAYILVSTSSIFYSTHRLITLQGLIGKLYEYSLMFVIALTLGREPSMAHRGIRALRLATWLVVLHSLLQQWWILRVSYTTVRDPILGQNLHYGRMMGPYKNPNDLATYLMVTGLVLIAALLPPRNRKILPREFLLIVLLVGCLIWTQSKGALLGFGAGILILCTLHWNQEKVSLRLFGGLAVTVLFFGYLARYSLRELITLTDVASRERLTMWSTAWSMIQAHPFRGLGYNTFMANYDSFIKNYGAWPAYAHNCYLQIAAETGIFGLLTFFLFLFLSGLFCWHTLCFSKRTTAVELEQRPLLAGLVAGLFAFLVQSTFDTNFYALRQAVLFWTLAGLAVGLASSIRSQGTEEPRS